MIHLTIEDGQLVAKFKGSVIAVITCLADLAQFDGAIIMCSSSLDHPEEDTDNANLIALCREIRA